MTPYQMEKLQALKAKLQERRKAIRNILTTADGKVLLDTLSDEFFEGGLADPDPNKTFMNLGAREVVRYLRSLALEE